jgi:hypothetical protein
VGQKSKKKIKSKRTKMNILKILRRELLHSLLHNSVLLVHHCMNDDTSRQPTEYEAAKEKKRKKEKMKRKSFPILRGHELNVLGGFPWKFGKIDHKTRLSCLTLVNGG